MKQDGDKSRSPGLYKSILSNFKKTINVCFFQVEGGNKFLNYRNDPKRQLDKQTFNLIKFKKISNLWKRLIKTITIKLIGTQITVT